MNKSEQLNFLDILEKTGDICPVYFDLKNPPYPVDNLGYIAGHPELFPSFIPEREESKQPIEIRELLGRSRNDPWYVRSGNYKGSYWKLRPKEPPKKKFCAKENHDQGNLFFHNPELRQEYYGETRDSERLYDGSKGLRRKFLSFCGLGGRSNRWNDARRIIKKIFLVFGPDVDNLIFHYSS